MNEGANNQFLHQFSSSVTGGGKKTTLLAVYSHVSHQIFWMLSGSFQVNPPQEDTEQYKFSMFFNRAQMFCSFSFANVFSKCDAWSSVPYVSPKPAASYLFIFIFFHLIFFFSPTEPKMYFPFYVGNLSVGRFWKRNYTASETYQLSWRRGRTLLKHWIETLKLWHSI